MAYIPDPSNFKYYKIFGVVALFICLVCFYGIFQSSTQLEFNLSITGAIVFLVLGGGAFLLLISETLALQQGERSKVLSDADSSPGDVPPTAGYWAYTLHQVISLDLTNLRKRLVCRDIDNIAIQLEELERKLIRIKSGLEQIS